MRWKVAECPRHGDRKTTTWFAWLPVVIDTEVRWLESVRVVWEWCESRSVFNPSKWIKVRFVDEMENA